MTERMMFLCPLNREQPEPERLSLLVPLSFSLNSEQVLFTRTITRKLRNTVCAVESMELVMVSNRHGVTTVKPVRMALSSPSRTGIP
nr:MAG TPA: hypothetical protein [Caudoviricetes sp.]